jgi:putative transposase
VALKPIYQAPGVDAAAEALDEFEIEWGDRYPAIVDLWRRNWERFTPFLAFDPAIRKIIYATDEIVNRWRRVFGVASGPRALRRPVPGV